MALRGVLYDSFFIFEQVFTRSVFLSLSTLAYMFMDMSWSWIFVQKSKIEIFFVKKSDECTANTIKSNRKTFKSKLIFVFYRKSLLESKIGFPIKLFLYCLFDFAQLRSPTASFFDLIVTRLFGCFIREISYND